MSERRGILLQNLDIAAGAGIEIGALAWPIVARSDGAITYVDWADTPTLRRKYADDPNVDVDRIVQVDAVWGEKTLSEAVGVDRRFDYVVASHVVEHVPDLITWIRELLAVLKQAGEVRLAVPDKRFTFDFLRNETTLADVLGAHLHQARRPMVGPVLDFFINYINADLLGLWEKTVDPATLQPDPARVPLAVDMARRALADEYNDVHCWVFTPVSFTRLMGQLVAAGWLDCRCTMFTDTARHQLEFFIGLAPEPDREVAVASWRRAAAAVAQGSARTHSGLAGLFESRLNEQEKAAIRQDLELTAGELARVQDALAEVQDDLPRIQGELERTRRHLAQATARAAAAELRVAALLESRSWRYTAMLRWLRDRLARRG
jgi:SAM-dependent methyltransferase